MIPTMYISILSGSIEGSMQSERYPTLAVLYRSRNGCILSRRVLQRRNYRPSGQRMSSISATNSRTGPQMEYF